MSTSANPPSDQPQGFLERHHFLFRRLHSLSGIVPVGIFVIMHLFTNFQLAVGDFQHEVEFIHSLPALLFIEISLWGGIGFHAGLGLIYTFTGKTNVQHYQYAGNWRYTLQRITGIIALLFIFIHVATLRWGWTLGILDTPFYLSAEGKPLAAATTAMALQHAPWVTFLYIVGVFSVVYHWSNGLWTAAITWGLTLSASSQKRWGYACAALGLTLSIFSAGAIYGALTYDVSKQEQALVEQLKTGELQPVHPKIDQAKNHPTH